MDVLYHQLFTALGMAGCICYVVSYFLVQMGYISGNSYYYVVMNLIAALMMLVSLTQAFNLGAAVLQVLWIGISAAGIIRRLNRDRLA